MKKSAKKLSSVPDASSLSAPNHIHDESREPKSSYAKFVMQRKEARFLREYLDDQGKRHVIVKVPGRAGRVKVHWVFNPIGEAMRKAAIERHARRAELYPRGRGGRIRFPRLAVRRFPRLARAKGK